MRPVAFCVFLVPPVLLLGVKSSDLDHRQFTERAPAYVHEKTHRNESSESYIRCISDCDLEGLKMVRCEKRCTPARKSAHPRGI